jgi:hypothetical protein
VCLVSNHQQHQWPQVYVRGPLFQAKAHIVAV